MRAVLRQPLPFAEGVCVVPEHGPAVAPNPLSDGSSLATACRAPWRAASATVELTQSTRKMSMLSASRKNRMGKMRANSTSAWPRSRLMSVLGPLVRGDGDRVRRTRHGPEQGRDDGHALTDARCDGIGAGVGRPVAVARCIG